MTQPLTPQQLVKLHDDFLQASSDKNYPECLRIRAEIERSQPRFFAKPFIKHCPGHAPRPHSNNNMPKGGRHRWMFYDMYGEERCMYCHCQRPASKLKGAAQ
jgi:hypothetical protein